MGSAFFIEPETLNIFQTSHNVTSISALRHYELNGQEPAFGGLSILEIGGPELEWEEDFWQYRSLARSRCTLRQLTLGDEHIVSQQRLTTCLCYRCYDMRLCERLLLCSK